MNAGSSRTKAIAQATANAKYTDAPRYLFIYNGVYWLERERPKTTPYTEVFPDGTVKEHA